MFRQLRLIFLLATISAMVMAYYFSMRVRLTTIKAPLFKYCEQRKYSNFNIVYLYPTNRNTDKFERNRREILDILSNALKSLMSAGTKVSSEFNKVVPCNKFGISKNGQISFVLYENLYDLHGSSSRADLIFLSINGDRARHICSEPDVITSEHAIMSRRGIITSLSLSSGNITNPNKGDILDWANSQRDIYQSGCSSYGAIDGVADPINTVTIKPGDLYDLAR